MGRTTSSMYGYPGGDNEMGRTASSMYGYPGGDNEMGRTASSMYGYPGGGDNEMGITASSMYGYPGGGNEMGRTASSMYEDGVRGAARTASSMYGGGSSCGYIHDGMVAARTASSMGRGSETAKTAAAMHSDFRPLDHGGAPSSYMQPCSVTKASFPKPLFPRANTASAYGEFW
jgi:hypothetical protein